VQSNQAKSADGQKLAPGRAIAESAWFAQDGEHGGPQTLAVKTEQVQDR
jgi:hypothetical protein